MEDHQTSWADFHKFLATQGERISHANFPFNALEGEVDPANLISALEPFGYSAALAPLLECLNAGVDESYEVPDVPLKWGSVSLTNLSSALHEGLVLRPNREFSQKEREVTAFSAMRAGKERNNKAYPLFVEIQERTASVFKDLLQIGPLVQSGCVLSQVPESCHEGLSLSILLGDQEREFNRNPEGFNHHDIRYFSLYDNSLDERDLNKVRFDYFTNIKTIDVSGNFLTRLPRVLSRLPTLESLDLSRNRSLELEASDINLPNLRYLDLRGTKVAPEEVEALRSRYPQAEILAKAPIPKPPEQTAFSVRLIDPGQQKIKVIKFLSEHLSLDLKGAKQLVDSHLVMLREGIEKATATDLAEELQRLGASVDLI